MICDTNKLEWDDQAVVLQTISDWNFECKEYINTDLFKAKKAIYRHWSKWRGCHLPILNQSLGADPYQLSPLKVISENMTFISCHSISIGLIRISFVWTGWDDASTHSVVIFQSNWFFPLLVFVDHQWHLQLTITIIFKYKSSCRS